MPARHLRREDVSGVSSGVKGTPSFFADGVRHEGPWSDPARSIAALEPVDHGAAVP